MFMLHGVGCGALIAPSMSMWNKTPHFSPGVMGSFEIGDGCRDYLVHQHKHFFTTGYQTSDGNMLSSRSIKSKIQALVSEEDSSHPLSDQKIVALLKNQGVPVARRTVAKYREELGIQSSHLRKSYTI